MISYIYNPFTSNLDAVDKIKAYSALGNPVTAYPEDTFIVEHPPVSSMLMIPFVYEFLASISQTSIAYSMDWYGEYVEEIPGDITYTGTKVTLKNNAPPATIYRKDVRDLPTTNDVKTGTDAATGWIYVDYNGSATSDQSTAVALKTSNTNDAIILDLPDDIFTFPYDFTVTAMVKSGSVNAYIDDTLCGTITSTGQIVDFDSTSQSVPSFFRTVSLLANLQLVHNNNLMTRAGYYSFIKDGYQHIIYLTAISSYYKWKIDKILSDGTSIQNIVTTADNITNMYINYAAMSILNVFMYCSATSGKYKYSTDLINYTEYTLPGSLTLVYLYSANNIFFCCPQAASTSIYYCTDGANWTSSTLPAAKIISGILYFDNKYWLLSDSVIYTTTDFVTYLSITIPASLSILYVLNNVLIMAGVSSFIYIPSGSTTYVTPVNKTAIPTFFYNGYYFASGVYSSTLKDNCIFYTKDFITWGILFHASLENNYRYFLEIESNLYLYILNSTTNITTRVKIIINEAGVPSLVIPKALTNKTVKATGLTAAVSNIVFRDNIGFYLTSTSLNSATANISTDYGTSWTTYTGIHVISFAGQAIKLIYDKDIDRILLFTNSTKVFATTDGLSWYQIFTLNHNGASALFLVDDYYITQHYNNSTYSINATNKYTGVCTTLASGSNSVASIVLVSKVSDKFLFLLNSGSLRVSESLLVSPNASNSTISITIVSVAMSNRYAYNNSYTIHTIMSSQCRVFSKNNITGTLVTPKIGCYVSSIVVVDDIFIAIAYSDSISYIIASNDTKTWIDLDTITGYSSMSSLSIYGDTLYAHSTTVVISYSITSLLSRFNELTANSVIKIKAISESIVSTVGVNVEAADMSVVPEYTGQSGDYLLQNPSYVTPRYFITDSWDVTAKKVISITGVTLNAAIPANTVLKGLISLDDGISWNTYFSGYVPIVVSNLRESLNSDSVDLSILLSGLATLTITDQKIKIAIDMRTTDTTVTPEINSIVFNYIQDGIYQAAAVGKGLDWEFYNITDTQAVFTYKGTQPTTALLHVLPLA